MTGVEAGAVAGIGGLVLGAVTGAISARYTLRKDKREAATLKLETNEAEDKATAHLIGLLKEANELAIKNERLQYEAKLADKMAEMREHYEAKLGEMREHYEARMNQLHATLTTDMNKQVRKAVDEALDASGCENASKGCKQRIALRRPDYTI